MARTKKKKRKREAPNIEKQNLRKNLKIRFKMKTNNEESDNRDVNLASLLKFITRKRELKLETQENTSIGVYTFRNAYNSIKVLIRAIIFIYCLMLDFK